VPSSLVDDVIQKPIPKPVGLGLKSLQINVAEQQKSSVEARHHEMSNRKYSLEEISSAWKAYTDECLKDDLMVQSVFRMAELVMLGYNHAEVRLSGSTQIVVFNEQRGALSDFFRERFGMQGIELSVVKTAITDVAIEYQTDKQKYEHLVKDYPMLDELRRRLKLRIDY
jgi:hypothetical protein